MNADAKSLPILVTGGSGFLASWIVKLLLEDGATVHATVRSKAKKEKYAHLEAIAGKTSGTLKFFEADLLHDGSFHEAMQGCGTVMHTASPFIVQGIKNPQEQLIRPALQGTQNVLQSAQKTSSVQRVVLTSSVVSIYGDGQEVLEKNQDTITEEMWNETSTIKYGPYALSKTLAEKEAWKMAGEQNQWDLVTINPSFIMGPALTKASDSASLDIMKQLMGGQLKSGVPEMHFGIVDVRDVARAHVEAAFRPDAKGRHIVSNTHSVTMLQMADAIRKKFPERKLPSRQLPKFMMYLAGPFLGFSWKYVSRNIGIPVQFDNSKSISALGIKYHSPEEAIQATAQSMADAGLV